MFTAVCRMTLVNCAYDTVNAVTSCVAKLADVAIAICHKLEQSDQQVGMSDAIAAVVFKGWHGQEYCNSMIAVNLTAVNIGHMPCATQHNCPSFSTTLRYKQSSHVVKIPTIISRSRGPLV